MVLKAVTKNLNPVATILAGIGALNWIFAEFLSTDLVQLVSMGSSTFAAVIYGLAGLAGLGAIIAGLSQLEWPY